MKTTIHQLPQNILIEIFLHLSADSLTEASKVCQRWSFIIRTTPRITKTISVKITSNRSTDNITIFDPVPGALHQNIEIVDFFGDFLILEQILFMHRNFISCIKIARPANWRAKKFINTFSSLRYLSQLTLDNCQLRDIEMIESGEKFVSLRHLTVVDCCCEIFEIFKDCNLTSLTVECSPKLNPQKTAFMKSLTNLLKNSSTISSLTILGVVGLTDNFLAEKTNFKFQLRLLKLDEIEGPSVSECCVVNFLKSQSSTLEKISILKPPKSEKLQNLINEIRSSISC